MLRVALAAPNTSYSLATLLRGIDANCPVVVTSVEIQFDPDAGAAYLYIGNSDVSAANWGVKLSGGQAYTPPPLSFIPSGWDDLSTWFLFSDTGGVFCGITVTG